MAARRSVGGYQIENQSTYWLMATGVTSSGLSYPTPGNDVFDYPVIAPGATVSQQYSVTPTTALFEITWNTGLPYNTHESDFFTVSAELYTGSPFGGETYVGSVNISTPYDASAPEPFSVLLFATAFGVAVWTKARRLGPGGRQSDVRRRTAGAA